jgi:hypothetical protein
LIHLLPFRNDKFGREKSNAITTGWAHLTAPHFNHSLINNVTNTKRPKLSETTKLGETTNLGETTECEEIENRTPCQGEATPEVAANKRTDKLDPFIGSRSE